MLRDSILVLYFFLVCITYSVAQTQKIAYKSHSGSANSFKLEKDNKNNIGLPSNIAALWHLKLDSVALVQFLQDSTVGKKVYKALKKSESEGEYINCFTKKEIDTNIKKYYLFRTLQEALSDYQYEETREYVLQLMQRHLKASKTPKNTSGSLFSIKRIFKSMPICLFLLVFLV